MPASGHPGHPSAGRRLRGRTGACTLACALPVCGDTFTQAGEECDDGNLSNADACLGTCKLAKCGDTFVQAGVEQCDDGNASNTDTCTNTCKAAVCGDTFTQPAIGEQCDDGNQVTTDACTNTCKSATCGDAIVWAGNEQCDDGNAVNTDACVAGCKTAKCGDGFVQMGVETCDDGNVANNDGCSASCQIEISKCGNGVIDPGEHCDTALPTPGPGVGCKPVTCLYDFSQITQLYCNGTCTWAGGEGCDQADANILCKLKTGNANSIATSWTPATAQPTFGFSCPGYTTNLGPLPAFGVPQNVWYQGASILGNHGPGNIILNPVCTNP